MTHETQHGKIPYYLIVIFLLLSVTIWVGGYLYYEDQKKAIKKDKLEELAAIADLKVSQILNWRRERLGTAFQYTARQERSNSASAGMSSWKIYQN